MTRRGPWHAGSVALMLLLVVQPAKAQSAPAATVEVSVIQAARADAGDYVDPELRELSATQLREQPFLRYNAYRLLDRKRHALEANRTITNPLADGRTLQIALIQVMGSGPRARYKLRAELDEPKHKPVVVEVSASQGEPFFVAGRSFRGGALFIELVVVPR